MVMLLSASSIPLRKAIEETCPSAVARKLRMKRNEPGGTIRLIQVRHHRGIEQRGGFERILVSEIPAQQQLSFFGQSLAIEQIGADLVKPPAEEFVDLQLAVAEFGPNPVQKGMDFAFGKSHDPGGDLDGARGRS